MTTETKTIIKANELRISNKIFFKGQICTVKEICPGADNDWGIYDFVLINGKIVEFAPMVMIEPIPLTYVILEKCGFNKPDEYWFWFLDYKSNVNTFKLIETPDGGEYKILECFAPAFKYLHQLQNLFYSLTGTELEVNLSEKV
jgi:hypothetical protein